MESKFYQISEYCPVCGDGGGSTVLLKCVKQNECIFHCLSCGICWELNMDPNNFEVFTNSIEDYCLSGVSLPSKNIIDQLFNIIDTLSLEDSFFEHTKNALKKGSRNEV